MTCRDFYLGSISLTLAIFLTKASIEWSGRDFETGLTASWALRSASTGRNKLAAAWHWQCSTGMSRRVFCCVSSVFALNLCVTFFQSTSFCKKTRHELVSYSFWPTCRGKRGKKRQESISMLDLAISIKSSMRLAIELSKIPNVSMQEDLLKWVCKCQDSRHALASWFVSTPSRLWCLCEVWARSLGQMAPSWSTGGRNHHSFLEKFIMRRKELSFHAFPANEFRPEGLKLLQFGPFPAWRFHVSRSQELCYYCGEWRRLVVIWFVVRKGKAHNS